MAQDNPVRRAMPDGEAVITFMCTVGPDGFPINPQPDDPTLGVPLGFQQLEPSDLEVAIGLTIPLGATMALVQAESGDVRWRIDGPSPTGSIGFIIQSGYAQKFLTNLSMLKFIASAGQAGAILNVGYFG